MNKKLPLIKQLFRRIERGLYMSKKKKSKMTMEQRMVHAPSPLHLDACRQGSRTFRNKKKYTRKWKERFDARKYQY